MSVTVNAVGGSTVNNNTDRPYTMPRYSSQQKNGDAGKRNMPNPPPSTAREREVKRATSSRKEDCGTVVDLRC